jgi:CheY-like chemotaxis protein
MGNDFEDLFGPENDNNKDNNDNTSPLDCWKVLIVDDEEEVHSVTKLALTDFSFEGRKAILLSAYSGQEAMRLMDQHPDIALILLDVVMEHENSGLTVVKYIRESLKNREVRIVLRTGQPGQAPEKKVIIDYDINDYKTKSELTAQKLFTMTVASLRAYKTIVELETNRRKLGILNAFLKKKNSELQQDENAS